MLCRNTVSARVRVILTCAGVVCLDADDFSYILKYFKWVKKKLFIPSSATTEFLLLFLTKGSYLQVMSRIVMVTCPHNIYIT